MLYIKDTNILNELNLMVTGSDSNEKEAKLLFLLNEKSEARIFEVVSFSILKIYYSKKYSYIGETVENVKKVYYELFKTGRTNANDGGIDFVLQPIGKFFQVTEVNNYDKYLLDMDKVSHYPITFVVKTNNENIFEEFINHIDNKNIDDFTKNNYKNSIGGMITINNLKEYLTDFDDIDINNTFNEIIFQYKLEFNIL